MIAPCKDIGSVLVAGHVNHDRIWRLEAPLIAGQRQKWLDCQISVGGGGWFTSTRLAALGARVDLVSAVARDAQGQQTHDLLTAHAIGTTHIDRQQSETVLTEILLGADGERTILQAPIPVPVFELAATPDATPVATRGAYLNLRRAGPQLIAHLAKVPLVMVQLPIAPLQPLPGDLAITSQADFPQASPAQILELARNCLGGRLRALILTDGPAPVQIVAVDGTVQTIPVAAPLALRNSIGAGDSFAGCLLHALLEGRALDHAVLAANAQVREWLSKHD